MRVGLVVYGLERQLTGIGRYTLELVSALSQIIPRPDIYLLCAGSPGRLAAVRQFPVIPLPGCRFLPGLVLLGNFLIPLLSRRMHLDLVHDPTGATPFSLGLGRVASVVTVHDVFPWSLPGSSTKLDTLIYRKWLPRVLPRCDALITLSAQSRRDIVKYLAVPDEQITIVPHGVNQRFHPIPDEVARRHILNRFKLSGRYILSVGAPTRRKNIRRALQAYARIQSHYPDLQYVIVAPGSSKLPQLNLGMECRSLSKRIHLTGSVMDDDLVALYNCAELLCFPSLYEGFGLPVLEAMACGTPVVASNTSSLPEVAGEAGLLFIPHDVEDIASAMRRVLDEPELAQELRKRGLDRARRFSWDKTARTTLSVYAKSMDKK